MTESGGAPRVRQASVADADIIVHQRRGMFADMGEGDERQLDAMAAHARPFIEAALEDGSYRGWLVEVGGRVVAGGGVAILRFPPAPLDPDSRRAWVLNISTEPAFRRQGLAKLVLETILAWCREEGFRRVSLHASDAGRPLYESLGFEPTNEMRLVLK